MAYKFKPNKSIAKRFKVTKTGKLKRGHSLTSHLMSARSSKKKRHLGRPALVDETIARNLRKLIGVAKRNPNRIRHERELAAKKAETAGAEAK
jgi:large subunit ribosomal protein L35